MILIVRRNRRQRRNVRSEARLRSAHRAGARSLPQPVTCAPPPRPPACATPPSGPRWDCPAGGAHARHTGDPARAGRRAPPARRRLRGAGRGTRPPRSSRRRLQGDVLPGAALRGRSERAIASSFVSSHLLRCRGRCEHQHHIATSGRGGGRSHVTAVDHRSPSIVAGSCARLRLLSPRVRARRARLPRRHQPPLSAKPRKTPPSAVLRPRTAVKRGRTVVRRSPNAAPVLSAPPPPPPSAPARTISRPPPRVAVWGLVGRLAVSLLSTRPAPRRALRRARLTRRQWSSTSRRTS